MIAALFEIGWAIGLKYTDGFSRLWPSVWTIAALAVSVGLLAVAARTLPIGTAYAVWTGIGAAGTALLGIWLFNEPATCRSRHVHSAHRVRCRRAEDLLGDVRAKI